MIDSDFFSGQSEMQYHLAIFQDDDTIFRDRYDLAPELLHSVAIESLGAGDQLGRIYQMLSSLRVHIHFRVREMASQQETGGARMVQVNVCDEEPRDAGGINA